MKTLTTFIISATLILTSAIASASELSPYQVLENAGNNLFSRIAASQQKLASQPEYMEQIIEEELMPAVDYRYAAYKILGKRLKNTTTEQRKSFVQSMRSYLVRTYARALNQYTDQQVIFEPAKPTGNKRIVGISTRILDNERPPIDITFKMRQNRKTLQWKAYDMVVEGVSLLNSKQAELNNRIARQGLEQVTVEMAKLNR